MNAKPRLVVPIGKLAEVSELTTGDVEFTPIATRPEIRPAAAEPRSRTKWPDVGPIVHCLNYDDPTFREPEKGEFVMGLYRAEDGRAAALLLWADPKVDLFWDVALRQHVKPPKFYMRLSEQPQIDCSAGHPVIDGAACPF